MFHLRDGVPFEDPLNLLRRAAIKLYSIWVGMTYPFAFKGRNLSIHYRSELPRSHAHRIKLGRAVTLQKDAALYVRAPLDGKGDPVVVIDEGCVIGRRSTISAKNGVYLERDVILGSSVFIQDHSHAYSDITLAIWQHGMTEGGRIRIGQGCWIGDGAVVHCDNGELTLGRNCVVAPNSLVIRSFPACSLISGNPAHVLKQFDPVRGVWVLGLISPAPTEAVHPQPGAYLRSSTAEEDV